MKAKIGDKILYLRLRRKDRDAFIETYDQYFDQIFRFVFFKVNDTNEAEDITSMVFLKSWAHVQNNTITDYGTLRALLYRVARNLVIDYYRQNSRQKNISLDDDARRSLDFSDKNQDIVREVGVSQEYDLVKKKLFDLKEEYREFIVMRYINELSISEIAGVLNKSRGSVRIGIYRSLRALRNIIEKDNERQGNN